MRNLTLNRDDSNDTLASVNKIRTRDSHLPQRTFAQVLTGKSTEGIPLKESEPLRMISGNIAITVDEDEYAKGLVKFTHSQK